ncbi:MAG: hypothetical protein D6681_14035 [Calditrichaeota bacterium]|nr:MAG: hypothetical protein D6681_14035 [Calditrichota bacterium]
MLRVLDRIPEPNPDWDGRDPDPGSSRAPWRIYNIGNSSPVGLLEYIEALEKALGIQAKKNFLPIQPGEVPETFADVQELMADVGFRPRTPVRTGVQRFVKWYREYYDV